MEQGAFIAGNLDMDGEGQEGNGLCRECRLSVGLYNVGLC